MKFVIHVTAHDIEQGQKAFKEFKPAKSNMYGCVCPIAIALKRNKTLGPLFRAIGPSYTTLWSKRRPNDWLNIANPTEVTTWICMFDATYNEQPARMQPFKFILEVPDEQLKRAGK